MPCCRISNGARAHKDQRPHNPYFSSSHVLLSAALAGWRPLPHFQVHLYPPERQNATTKNSHGKYCYASTPHIILSFPTLVPIFKVRYVALFSCYTAEKLPKIYKLCCRSCWLDTNRPLTSSGYVNGLPVYAVVHVSLFHGTIYWPIGLSSFAYVACLLRLMQVVISDTPFSVRVSRSS